MGLSRNKVAVSEGAAGSPPFYGERGNRNVTELTKKTKNDESKAVQLLFDFQGPEHPEMGV